ncbi:single-stranded DNA-binding protein [Sporosarcina sp. FSL K6-6792]|uniref:single-stranded DNA-binding protein n=1 Tax=Sporosarcina sp. FSL K6-6792 TaxID=2921559 RepID=UPI0030FAD131
MINRTVLVGRLTKDPELKYTQTGIAVTRFTLAVNRAFQNASGEREADFISCVAWRKQAENVANFLKKGSLVGLDGRIQTGSFEGQDGKRVYTTEIVADSVQFLEPRNSNSNNESSNQSNGSNQSGQTNTQNQQQDTQNRRETTYNAPDRQSEDPFNTGGAPIEVSDDDLPF